MFTSCFYSQNPFVCVLFLKLFFSPTFTEIQQQHKVGGFSGPNNNNKIKPLLQIYICLLHLLPESITVSWNARTEPWRRIIFFLKTYQRNANMGEQKGAAWEAGTWLTFIKTENVQQHAGRHLHTCRHPRHQGRGQIIQEQGQKQACALTCAWMFQVSKEIW